MRRLITIILTLATIIIVLPRSPEKDLINHHSYYPEAPPLDSIVEAIHLQYDTYRSQKHGISLNLATSIRVAATAEGIPLPLAFSLVQIESTFNSMAVSHAGAIGLTQVMPATGRAHCSLSKRDLYAPADNLACGFSYLRMLYDRTGQWYTALASYNVGDARRIRAHLTGEPDGSVYANAVINASD
jgi:soluble lytic murein transglycosylase-like protein|tara:strand:+ start:32407 stop:32964 length:558 start_codon:yes stop_codon:yes gene_type:complete